MDLSSTKSSTLKTKADKADHQKKVAQVILDKDYNHDKILAEECNLSCTIDSFNLTNDQWKCFQFHLKRGSRNKKYMLKFVAAKAIWNIKEKLDAVNFVSDKEFEKVTSKLRERVIITIHVSYEIKSGPISFLRQINGTEINQPPQRVYLIQKSQIIGSLRLRSLIMRLVKKSHSSASSSDRDSSNKHEC